MNHLSFHDEDEVRAMIQRHQDAAFANGLIIGALAGFASALLWLLLR